MHEIAHSVLPGELVFDIGAHTGAKTEWFAARGARVIAVEPQPEIAEALRKRFDGDPNVVVVEKGVSRDPGMMTMHINVGSPMISTFSEEWKTGRFKDYVWNRQTPVEVTTMDQLIAEHGIPRYTKIDVEGHEKDVMLGLTRHIGTLSLEFTKEFLQNTRDILWYSRGLGYRNYNLSLGERDCFELKRWVSIDEVLGRLNSVCSADPEAWGDVYLR